MHVSGVNVHVLFVCIKVCEGPQSACKRLQCIEVKHEQAGFPSERFRVQSLHGQSVS